MNFLKEIRYRNAQEHFLRTIRYNGGDGTAYAMALEEYKSASDARHEGRYNGRKIGTGNKC